MAPRSRHEDVPRKDRELVVPVSAPPRHDGPWADVTSLDDLLRVARRYDAMVLRHAGPGGVDHLVWDHGLMYRHRSAVAVSDLLPADVPVVQAAPGPATTGDPGAATTPGAEGQGDEGQGGEGQGTTGPGRARRARPASPPAPRVRPAGDQAPGD